MSKRNVVKFDDSVQQAAAKGDEDAQRLLAWQERQAHEAAVLGQEARIVFSDDIGGEQEIELVDLIRSMAAGGCTASIDIADGALRAVACQAQMLVRHVDELATGEPYEGREAARQMIVGTLWDIATRAACAADIHRRRAKALAEVEPAP